MKMICPNCRADVYQTGDNYRDEKDGHLHFSGPDNKYFCETHPEVEAFRLARREREHRGESQ